MDDGAEFTRVCCCVLAVPAAARWLRNGHPAPHILGIHARQLQHAFKQKSGLTWHPFKLLVQSGTVLAFSRGKRIEKRSAKLVCVYYFHHHHSSEQVGSLRFYTAVRIFFFLNDNGIRSSFGVLEALVCRLMQAVYLYLLSSSAPSL